MMNYIVCVPLHTSKSFTYMDSRVTLNKVSQRACSEQDSLISTICILVKLKNSSFINVYSNRNAYTYVHNNSNRNDNVYNY